MWRREGTPGAGQLEQKSTNLGVEADPGMASGSEVGERGLGGSTETMNDHPGAHGCSGLASTPQCPARD